ncbi:MAG TPA: pseudouridine synthase [Clostridia bacterium]|nr:pseudouridine synthase [Clostridia bacterium]
MKMMRLDRYLSNSGVGSRKQVKAIIKNGVVSVDNRIIKDSGSLVNPFKSQVMIEGEPIVYKEFYYLMLNKPAGVISSTRDTLHETVIDLLPAQYHHVDLFPVGRLDKDTEGLLLLTNDGQLAHSLLSPRKRIPKTYYATIKGKVTNKDVEIFEKGIELEEDFITLPAKLSIIESGDVSEIHVTIYEGKFHQVKRMFKAVDKEVIYLKRINMGNLALDEDLAPGEIRELSTNELASLKSSNAD